MRLGTAVLALVAPAAGDVRTRHFEAVRLACGSTAHFLRKFKRSHPATLWVIHQSRADLPTRPSFRRPGRRRDHVDEQLAARGGARGRRPAFH